MNNRSKQATMIVTVVILSIALYMLIGLSLFLKNTDQYSKAENPVSDPTAGHEMVTTEETTFQESTKQEIPIDNQMEHNQGNGVEAEDTIKPENTTEYSETEEMEIRETESPEETDAPTEVKCETEPFDTNPPETTVPDYEIDRDYETDRDY